MGLAEEKVYEYIMKNLQNLKSIRVSSLADSLTCLTDADRVIPCFPNSYQAPSPIYTAQATYSCLTSKPDPILDALCVLFRMNFTPGRKHGGARRLPIGFTST